MTFGELPVGRFRFKRNVFFSHFFPQKVTQKLVAWNFATTVVHQRANRKFPRRHLQKPTVDAFNRTYYFFSPNKPCAREKRPWRILMQRAAKHV